MTHELGCDVCREGIHSGGQPHFVVATTPTDLLYRCEVCGTWWVGDSRSAHPVTPQQAHDRFPEQIPTSRQQLSDDADTTSIHPQKSEVPMTTSGFDDANHLYSLVEKTLGERVSGLILRSATAGVQGVLYDAFVFSLAIERPHGNLAAGILLEGGQSVTEPFGRRFSLEPDDSSVAGVLRQMDEWARLRLPDKYLERFELPSSQSAAASAGSPAAANSTLEYFAKITYRNGVRVPVRVFRVEDGQDQVYRDARSGWVPDEGRILDEHRMRARDHKIWPITRLQAGQAINMIESGEYHPLDIPGIFDR